jgi:tetratricopeptide (TPR) repeat protein
MEMPVIGASGAISGILGAFFINYFRTKMKFFYFIFPAQLLMGTFTTHTAIMLGIWFLKDLAGILNSTEMGAHIAFSVHIGGFLSGLFIIRFIYRLGSYRNKMPIAEIQMAAIESEEEYNGLTKALNFYKQNAFSKAVVVLNEVLEYNPENLDAKKMVFDIAMSTNNKALILKYSQSLIESLLDKNLNEKACYYYRLVNYKYPNELILAENKMLLTGNLFYLEQDIYCAHTCYQQFIKHYPHNPMTASVTVSLLEISLYYFHDLQSALNTYRHMREHYPDTHYLDLLKKKLTGSLVPVEFTSQEKIIRHAAA